MTATFTELETDAPDLAATIRRIFEANRHHVIGTVRRDGSPRLSGTEVHIVDGDVVIGMMADSLKLADVRRDARVEIHSAPLDTELRIGDAKLSGSLVEIGPTDGPEGREFHFAIERVAVVRVDGEELVIATWDPRRGFREIRRR